MRIADEIAGLFAKRGSALYLGEEVTQAEHALQTAHFAREVGAPPALVIAALLHDVGHLVVPVPDDLADWTQDARHEAIGGAWLGRRFAPDIAEPVRLHVAAKRYLCAVDPGYVATLSAASQTTLRLQGGPMPHAEIQQFEAQAYHAAALTLRRCDDRGKIPGLVTPALEDYRDWLDSFALATPGREGQ